MRRTASEVLRSLEMRVARLENRSARFQDLKLTRQNLGKIQKHLGSFAKNLKVSTEYNAQSRGKTFFMVRVEYMDVMSKSFHASFAVVSESKGRDQNIEGIYDSLRKAESNHEEFDDVI